MSEFKPDMSAYSEKKLADIERAIRNGEDPSDISAMANSLDYARLDDKPSEEAVNRLAAETKKQYVLITVYHILLLTLYTLELYNAKLDLVIVKKKAMIFPGSMRRIVSLTKRLQDFMTSIQKKFAKISKEVLPCKDSGTTNAFMKIKKQKNMHKKIQFISFLMEELLYIAT